MSIQPDFEKLALRFAPRSNYVSYGYDIDDSDGSSEFKYCMRSAYFTSLAGGPIMYRVFHDNEFNIVVETSTAGDSRSITLRIVLNLAALCLAADEDDIDSDTEDV